VATDVLRRHDLALAEEVGYGLGERVQHGRYQQGPRAGGPLRA